VRTVAKLIALTGAGVITVTLIIYALLPRSGGPSGRTQPPMAAGVPTASPTPTPATPESARKVKANELGLVPVIMYHRLLPKRIASIDRTPEQFRRELTRLAKEGYVPITAAEFVSGEIDIPAGMHPVVLTFDDGSPTHFALDENGALKPDTAVGILYEVAARYSHFRPVATFWVNRIPFGLTDEKEQARAVKWLLDRGFEVANHTYSHPDLRRLPAKRVREEIVRQERVLKRLGVERSTTFALPYGSLPRQRDVARKGKWDGTRYRFDGVFLAGSEPSVSPFAKSFSRYAIPRIQSNGKSGECRRWCSQYWLDWLAKHPEKRYTSDGDPTRISIPRKLQGKVDPGVAKEVLVY